MQYRDKVRDGAWESVITGHRNMILPGSRDREAERRHCVPTLTAITDGLEKLSLAEISPPNVLIALHVLHSLWLRKESSWTSVVQVAVLLLRRHINLLVALIPIPHSLFTTLEWPVPCQFSYSMVNESC